MLDPANATLHYSIECFEGAKAYVHAKDEKNCACLELTKILSE